MISTRCEPRKFSIPSHALFLWAKRLEGTLWSYNMFVSILYTIYDAMVFNFANCCNKMCITPFCNRNFFLHKNACKRMRLSAVFQKGNSITLATSIFHERDWLHIFLNWKPRYSRQNNQKGCRYLWEIMIQTKISWAGLSITLQTRTMPFVGRHRLSKAAG